jgi:hypothetical protein
MSDFNWFTVGDHVHEQTLDEDGVITKIRFDDRNEPIIHVTLVSGDEHLCRPCELKKIN